MDILDVIIIIIIMYKCTDASHVRRRIFIHAMHSAHDV